MLNQKHTLQHATTHHPRHMGRSHPASHRPAHSPGQHSQPRRAAARHHAPAAMARPRYRGMALKLSGVLTHCRTMRYQAARLLCYLKRARRSLGHNPCP
jgi:hypothetical protein